jgi:hypothetical protein
MKRVFLFHWNDREAGERVARLRAAGFAGLRPPKLDGPEGLRALRESAPDAVVIDLSRLPTQGRDVALVLRERKATRNVPLVFVEGDPAKVEGIRRLLPDAAYATWDRIGPALRAAIARPPAEPLVPASRMAGYSGTPLPRKLGIKPESTVALVGAPAGFEATLGEIPPGAKLRRRGSAPADLTLWFVRSMRELESGVAGEARSLGPSGLWILWPKRASGVKTDVTETQVRSAGLGAGLVDFKICAVDATWSGLKFTRPRKAPRRGGGGR